MKENGTGEKQCHQQSEYTQPKNAHTANYMESRVAKEMQELKDKNLKEAEKPNQLRRADCRNLSPSM